MRACKWQHVAEADPVEKSAPSSLSCCKELGVFQRHASALPGSHREREIPTAKDQIERETTQEDTESEKGVGKKLSWWGRLDWSGSHQGLIPS